MNNFNNPTNGYNSLHNYKLIFGNVVQVFKYLKNLNYNDKLVNLAIILNY